MSQDLIAKLTIRDAAVRQPDTGYILACDPKLEEDNVAHADFFKWHAGAFTHARLNFAAHTICITAEPRFSHVKLAGFGEFGIATPTGNFSGNVFDNVPDRKDPGSFRTVAEIAGKAYAVGHRGMVYRLDDFVKWTPIDKGLPDDFNVTAIDGFAANDLYAVGYGGAVWHYNGKKWAECTLPTNVNLTAVKCAGDGHVYVAGYKGVLVRGRGNTWNVIAKGETKETIWDLEWFQEKLYVSTMLFVYTLNGQDLELADFLDDTPESCYHLSKADSVLWSVGATDIMAYDGQNWTRIV